MTPQPITATWTFLGVGMVSRKEDSGPTGARGGDTERVYHPPPSGINPFRATDSGRPLDTCFF